jgi:hypothetical protein
LDDDVILLVDGRKSWRGGDLRINNDKDAGATALHTAPMQAAKWCGVIAKRMPPF